jgi:DNA-3-methyladenine glycosylase II
MSLALRPVPPFDLSLSLAFLRGFGPMVGEQIASSTTLTKALDLGGHAVAVRVRQKGDRERPTLDVDLFAERALGEGRWRQVLAGVRALLSTDEDLAPFHALAASDPPMAPLVTRLRGLHHVKFPSAFEAACWAVINQRIQLRAARAMKAALVRRAGSCAIVDAAEHWAFPGPEAVLRLGEDELAKLLPGGRRAVAVHAVARAFASVDATWLQRGPIDDVRSWLRAIHGVGPFTSSFVLYRGLGRFDGAAMVSPKLVAAATKLYGRPFSSQDVQQKATDYGAWGGHWMLYVWASSFVGDDALTAVA